MNPRKWLSLFDYPSRRLLTADAGDGGAGVGAGAGAPPDPGATPPPAGPPDFGAMMGDEAAFNSFRDALPDEVKAAGPMARPKTFEGFAKSYIEAQTLVGQDRLVIPKDVNDETGWGQVYEKLGRPANADGYKIEPANGQTFSDSDKAFHTHMRPLAHKAGLNQLQIDILGGGMTEFMAGAAGKMTEANARQTEQDWMTLQSELGTAKDEKFAKAKAAARALGVDETLLSDAEAKVGTAGLMRLMIKVGEAISPTGLKLDGDASQPGLVLTPTEATAKLADTEKGLKALMKEYQGKSGLNKDARYIQLQKDRKTLFAQKNPA